MSEHWTLLSSHGLVLFYLASRPNATVRETADGLGLSERRVASIIRDLEATRVVLGIREGRRKRYKVDPDARFRHPALSHVKLRDVLDLLRVDARPMSLPWRG